MTFFKILMMFVFIATLGCQGQDNSNHTASSISYVDPESTSPEVYSPPHPPTEFSIGSCDQSNLENLRKVCLLVNAEREKLGLSPLLLDANLAAVIKSHTDEMQEHQYLNHVNLAGQSPFDRLRAAGLAFTFAAENIAQGQATPQEVMSSWMNSKGHRDNILNVNFKKMGLSESSRYWGQIFTNY